MDYISTRGQTAPVSSAQAIATGIAPDGGLFVPGTLPRLGARDFSALATMDYRGTARDILGRFLTDFLPGEIATCVDAAYTATKFGSDEIAPLRALDADTDLLELWHGPTCAFKDMALQILPHLVVEALRKTGKRSELVILVATSGDTGKAALEGFRDVAGTRVVVFYPSGGVSEIQRLQMVTQEGRNVHAIGVDGGDFDDAQRGVKAIFGDSAFGARCAAKGFELSSANSINWGRLVPQICYYFWAYSRLVAAGRLAPGATVNVAVPTGNFGNILAAWYAREMGLPLARLVCASNENRVLADFFGSGVYDRNRALRKTMSPSMDIVVSSNLERLLFEVGGHESEPVRKWMESLSSEGRYEVDTATRARIDSAFWGAECGEAETLATIGEVWRSHRYVIDTHTAVAVNALAKYREATGDGTPAIVVSTASPFKFNGSVFEGIFGRQAVAGKSEFELQGLLSRDCGIPVPESLRGLRDKRVLHHGSCPPTGMAGAVAKALSL